jgi:hypothetical protein
MKNMKKLCTMFLATMLTASASMAGPLARNQVSASADWVVHVNHEQFNQSQFGQLIRAELAALGLEQKLQSFAQVFSFHPLDDVRDVTIYGSGPDEQKAVVIIDGKFDLEKLVSLAKLNPEYQAIEHGNVVLHRWLHTEKKMGREVNKLMYGFGFEGRYVVIGSGFESIKQAADVFNGSSPSAAGDVSGLPSQPALNAGGAFLQAAANNVAQSAAQHGKAAVLRQTDQLGLAIGEVNGQFYIDLAVTAKSAEAAQAMNKILDGVLAVAVLAGEEQPELANLAKCVRLSCDGNAVRVRLEADARIVFETLKKKSQQRDQQSGPL